MQICNWHICNIDIPQLSLLGFHGKYLVQASRTFDVPEFYKTQISVQTVFDRIMYLPGHQRTSDSTCCLDNKTYKEPSVIKCDYN